MWYNSVLISRCGLHGKLFRFLSLCSTGRLVVPRRAFEYHLCTTCVSRLRISVSTGGHTRVPK